MKIDLVLLYTIINKNLVPIFLEKFLILTKLKILFINLKILHDMVGKQIFLLKK